MSGFRILQGVLRSMVAGALLVIASSTLAQATAEEQPVDFTREVLPILSQQCFTCHGPDEGSREAGLRLDQEDAAKAELDSGATAIVPGRPEISELVARITDPDPDVRMPPAQPLDPWQIDVLRRWVAQGANFEDHWSFRPVVTVDPPAVKNSAWVRNPIDQFVLARLEQEGISPSPEADRATLLRRLSFDLIGLPPTPEEVRDFQNDTAPGAYERVVDRLLASPHFGERWGRHWLDLAHYADSDGYLGDALRPYAWLYRDWVINAVNNDLPFDQFTIEQLAGDLLPDATLEQRTATGFLRNTLRNTEAGVDLEEYRLKEIVDRVNTVGVGWMGLSLGCAECHSHKYDPISHREFYEFFSFFNNADDVDLPAPLPGETERYQADLAEWNVVAKQLTTAIQKGLEERDPAAEPVELKALTAALAKEARRRSKDQQALLERVRKESGESLRTHLDKYERHAAKKPKPPSTRVMTVARREKERVSYIHLRGDYRSRGETVSPGTPAALPALSSRGEQPDRLDLARWLVDANHPLTPRVTANRFWKHLFGRGLVSTIDNFGSGGDPPSHPELLDWLASQLIERGWSRKAFIRLVVNSATYRQASHQREDLEDRDPENVLLARQSRFRLEAEIVRDVALSASGLLEPRIGGESIRPPQPAYVASISRNADWKTSTAPDLYRRGMYILLRRATPYPMLLTFDAPDSTAPCVQRERSNSPLQALTLLNDPVFYECAQSLGLQLADASPPAVESRLHDGIARCLGREARPEEVERLRQLFDERLERLKQDPAAARAIVGKTASKDNHRAAEQAAWILIARVLMNLDEFITRE